MMAPRRAVSELCMNPGVQGPNDGFWDCRTCLSGELFSLCNTDSDCIQD